MDYAGFISNIYKISGIDLSLYKEKQMKRRIDSLISSSYYQSYYDFFNRLIIDKKLYDEFIKYITINVTEFFRNREQWDILEKDILPLIIKKNMKIWSAACSSGEEPYTLAMIISKYIDLKDIYILATDIDNAILAKAKKGIFNSKSIENVPHEYVKKYFKCIDNDTYEISDLLRKNITFKKHDLLIDKYPDNVDLIVCRNVLIYFNDAAKDNIYKKIYTSLTNNGIFFVGNTEQIIFPNKYNFESVKTFFYKKKNRPQVINHTCGLKY